MQKGNETVETSAAFLAELGDALHTCEGVDAGLAEIVSQHLLTTAPAEDCVKQALMTIIALATNRASPPKGNPDG